MKLDKVKPGTVLTVKPHDELLKKYGVNRFGSIQCKYSMTTDMQKLCGEKVVVKSVEKDGEQTYFKIGKSSFRWVPELFEEIKIPKTKMF